MKLDEYIAKLPHPPRKRQKLSDVQRALLARLWHASETFPKDWVTGSSLQAHVSQKSYARRLRELRNTLGCDIESKGRGRHVRYRLRSADLGPHTPKRYLKPRERQALFERHDFTCHVCGRDCRETPSSLEGDHRVPLSRGGNHEPSNWQALCLWCNVGKRRACQGCQLDCQACPWAFPDHVGFQVAVTLPKAIANQLAERHPDGAFDATVAAALDLYFQES